MSESGILKSFPVQVLEKYESYKDVFTTAKFDWIPVFIVIVYSDNISFGRIASGPTPEQIR